jgi:hypothetical protein
VGTGDVTNLLLILHGLHHDPGVPDRLAYCLNDEWCEMAKSLAIQPAIAPEQSTCVVPDLNQDGNV